MINFWNFIFTQQVVLVSGIAREYVKKKKKVLIFIFNNNHNKCVLTKKNDCL